MLIKSHAVKSHNIMIMAYSNSTVAGCIGKHICANNLAIMLPNACYNCMVLFVCIETKFVDHIATVESDQQL